MRRTTRSALAAALAVAMLGSVAVAPASAGTSPALHDCIAHAALTKRYSIAQLKQALSAMTPETKEYTNCPDVINRALAAAISGTGPTGGGGSGSFLPTPVIVLLVVLILAGAAFGGIAVRRRRNGAAGSP